MDMHYRKLGKTNLMVSEIGFGGEWLERHEEAESIALIRHAQEKGINIIDCWMPDPKSRDIIGQGIADCRDQWFVQGHIGSTWQGGQYVRDRDLAKAVPAFEDLMKRIGGGYIDLGMIHYVDTFEDWDARMNSERKGTACTLILMPHRAVSTKQRTSAALISVCTSRRGVYFPRKSAAYHFRFST